PFLTSFVDIHRRYLVILSTRSKYLYFTNYGTACLGVDLFLGLGRTGKNSFKQRPLHECSGFFTCINKNY
ncbi:hypothetical protein J4218_04595, partial [Candidatus Pacearchaeota archaeon]|nr:hypothetical protein [Candidatus Pacearchaeota archaeon]